MPKTDEVLLKRAKAMRSEMKQPEREIWTALRARRFANTKFSRQVVIGPYIADCAARSRKVIVEIDGDTHINERDDGRRTAWLETQGDKIIRFANSDGMQNLEGALLTIDAALATAPLPSPLPKGQRA